MASHSVGRALRPAGPYSDRSKMPRMTLSDPRQVYDFLDSMGIQYEKYEHPPVFTGAEAAEHWGPIKATQVKNLFLRNKKGDRQYLVILEITKEADLRKLV